MADVLRIRRSRPLGPQLARAAELLREGGLVAFPTETVYGLGANALDRRAVARIFRAKGRPADNPLIVHIGRRSDLARVVRSFPPRARRLMEPFWPGPLTLLFPRHPRLPRGVTAGLDTVAVRMPAHPVALELIRRSGVPVAAPSANRSGRPSPTRARDVAEDLGDRADLIVDGGPTPIGVESTVVSTLTSPPTLLRPGAVTREMLEERLGPVRLARDAEARRPLSPGMKHRHYAPRARVVVVEDADPSRARQRMEALARRYRARGESVAVLAGRNSGALARRLFAALRDLDRKGVDVVLVRGVGPEGLGLAVMDRLRRASRAR